MTKWLSRRILLKLSGLCTAGLVFQTTGCAIDLSQIGQEWLATVISTLATSYASDLFNAPTTGFF